MRLSKKFKSNMVVGLKYLCFLALLVSLFSLNLYSGTPCDKGLATLSISVSAMDEPCKIENTRPWFITVFNCDGTVLQFCGRSYILMPAECGCLDVQVPPGCYYIKAVWAFWVITPRLVYRVNHFTDAAIVQACCEKTTCVRLFNPSVHRCGIIYEKAVNDLIKQNAISADVGERVTEAVGAVNKEIPEPKNKFELGIEKEIEELMEKQRQQ